jgi:hypothetical protein
MNLESNETKQAKVELNRAFYKYRYLKLIDPSTNRALWLRFTILSSGNGFKRVAETWAIYYQRNQNKEVKKLAVKQTHDIQTFVEAEGSQIRIGDCELSENHTRGSIQSKGNSIQWDLNLIKGHESSFEFVPEVLTRLGLVRNSASTLCEDLLVSGTTQINGETIVWKEAPGTQGHFYGSKNGHSWVWGHCNTFLDEKGKQTQFIFDGMSVRTRIGPMIAPRFSSFYFYYQGKSYCFNTLKDNFHLKSKNTLNAWEFRADRNEVSFRGFVKAEHKDFAGLTYEDTNGSLLYCANSKLSEMRILVYRSGKLEATFDAQGTATFEVVSRDRNPYVPMLV